MLKIATIEDYSIILKLISNFYSTLPTSALFNKDKIEGIIKSFLVAPKEEKVVLLHGEVGLLAAMIQPFHFGIDPIATELAWWVEPEARKNNVGKELVEAFEFWAKKLNCTYIAMSCYADVDLGKFYQSLGYALHEKTYIKENK